MTEPSIKSAFSLGSTHYLNCAYMGPLSRAVEAAGIAGMARKRVPSALTRHHFFAHSDLIRAGYARLIAAPRAEDVAIVPSASYGFATVAKNLSLSRKQNVVVVGDEMPSGYYVWERLCRTSGAELRRVPAPAGARRAEAWNARLLEQIDPATALVSVSHVHWLDGTLFALDALRKRTDEFGAALIVDGTQSIGVLPFAVTEVAVDALITAGYKWLLGPYSIGAAYFGPRFRDGIPLEENWLNRSESACFERLIDYRDEYRSGAQRYDVGEASNFILAPMLAEALTQILDWGPMRIAEHCARLNRTIAEGARSAGYLVSPEDQRAPHYLAISLSDPAARSALVRELERNDVVVSVRGNYVRVTPHLYNDDDDAAALIAVLERSKSRSSGASNSAASLL